MMGPRRFCNWCGHELNQGSRFCTTCGRAVDEEDYGAAEEGHDAVPEENYGVYPGEENGNVPGERYGVAPGDDNGAPLAAEELAPGRAAAAPRPIAEEWRRRPADLRSQMEVQPSEELFDHADLPGQLSGGEWPVVESKGSPHRSPWLLAIGAVVLVVAGGATAGLFLLHSSRDGGGVMGNGSPSNIQTSLSPSAKPSLSPSPPPPPPSHLTVDGVPVDISAVNTDPNATAVAQTLGTYFGGINSRNFMQAWNTLAPSEQAANPFQQWSITLSTTKDTSVVVQSVQDYPNGDVNATVSFQSHQAPQYGPNPGETCTNWSLDYQFVPSGSASPPYLIENAELAGVGQVAC